MKAGCNYRGNSMFSRQFIFSMIFLISCGKPNFNEVNKGTSDYMSVTETHNLEQSADSERSEEQMHSEDSHAQEEDERGEQDVVNPPQMISGAYLRIECVETSSQDYLYSAQCTVIDRDLNKLKLGLIDWILLDANGNPLDIAKLDIKFSDNPDSWHIEVHANEIFRIEAQVDGHRVEHQGNENIFENIDTQRLYTYDLLLSQNEIEESELPDALAIDSKGRMVVAGFITDESENAAIWRYNPDGTIDTTFGENGLIRWSSDSCSMARLTGVFIYPDDSLKVAGVCIDDLLNTPNHIIGKFNSDGLPDSLFSSDGFRVVRPQAGTIRFYNRSQVFFDELDRTIFIETCNGSDDDLCLIRYDGFGDLDTSFAESGYLQWDYSNEPLNSPVSVRQYVGKGASYQGNYFIALGSETDVPGVTRAGHGAVLKLDANGIISSVLVDIPCKIVDLSVNATGVYFTGYKLPMDDYCWGKARLADLALETSYGDSGTMDYDLSSRDTRDRSTSITVNEQGEAFICGYTSDQGSDGKLVKISSDGRVDQSFQNSGSETFSDLYGFQGTFDRCLMSTFGPDGSLHVLGYSQTFIGNSSYFRTFIRSLYE